MRAQSPLYWYSLQHNCLFLDANYVFKADALLRLLILL